MLGLIANTLLMVLVFLSFPIGYVMGVFAESELDKAAGKIRIEKFFGVYAVVAEVFIVLLSFYTLGNAYTTVIGAVIVANLTLSAMHASVKADLIRLSGYGISVFAATTLGAVIMSLI